MIIFGWGGKHKNLGDGFIIECPNCNNTKTWQVVESSKRVSLYFVPVAKWDKKYLLICPICSTGVELESKAAAQELLTDASKGNQLLKQEMLERLLSE